MADRGTVTVFTWHEVAFPLWQEPRPQVEFFAEATNILGRVIPWQIRSNLQSLIDSGTRKGWVRWEFDGPISEEVRLRLQKQLYEYYGEPAMHFRWSGTRAKTTIESVTALGEYHQGATPPC